MDLLLLLTAIFASLTGGASDSPGTVRQVQGVAVVEAVQAAQAAVQPAGQVLSAAVVPASARNGLMARVWLAAAPLRSVRLVFERRLE